MDLLILESPHKRRGADLGECPKCHREGRSGRLKVLEAVDRSSPDSYGFAGCDADAIVKGVCGYSAIIQKRRPPRAVPCPECDLPMRRVQRRDGGHSLVCEKDGWFLADQQWQVVRSPGCPACGKPMVHRERSGTRGRFFWACFADRAFAEADVFGAITSQLERVENSTTRK
jgi:ribosomal protein L37AE/L43A